MNGLSAYLIPNCALLRLYDPFPFSVNPIVVPLQCKKGGSTLH